MDAEDELATAVAGREHWKRDGHAAVYVPPGAAATVHVLPRAAATRRNRFLAVITREGRAEHSIPCGSAGDAVVL